MLLLEINGSPCGEDLFLAYLDDSGLDDVLEFLLGLFPHDSALATWICEYIRVAELNRFDFAGLPMFESHEFFVMRSSASQMKFAFSAVP